MEGPEPAPFRRTVWTRRTDAGGAVHVEAGVDDHLHGFTVHLEVEDRSPTAGIRRAEAASDHRPWTTCPGAFASIAALDGPLADAAARLTAAPRSTTCVHLTDLVWLAARGHDERRYEVEVTATACAVRRDDEQAERWGLVDWTFAEGPYAGLGVGAPGWADVTARLDDDERERVRVVRRALAVGLGYHLLDWEQLVVAADVPAEVMAGSCHTFSGARLTQARSLVDPPRRRSR